MIKFKFDTVLYRLLQANRKVNVKCGESFFINSLIVHEYDLASGILLRHKLGTKRPYL